MKEVMCLEKIFNFLQSMKVNSLFYFILSYVIFIKLCLGDYLALYPCGAYGSSMMSNHCMRGMDLKEILITEEEHLCLSR